MNKLSDLQHSLLRFFIYIVLYALYILMVYNGIKTYFDPSRWIVTATLFFVVAVGTLAFHQFMPKRKLVVTVQEV